MIGRGLLLRAFEIPGVVFEDAASRVRHGFYRDISGLRLGYENDRFSVKALRGKPLVNVLPPTLPLEERRVDLLEAIDASVQVSGTRLGAAFLRNNRQGEHDEYLSLSLSSSLPRGIAGYLEIARDIGQRSPFFQFGEGAPSALYASITYSTLRFGGSLEFKQYHDFFLGAGFNDPPSLIKEHPYAVLNRSTHVLDPVDESGFQAEGYVRIGDAHRMTLNATRAVNDFDQTYLYQEYFGELAGPLFVLDNAKLFLDFAQDPFRGEERRISAGAYLEERLVSRWSATFDLQFQRFERELGVETGARNYVAGVAVSWSTRYTAGLVWERSTDPFLTDDIRTEEVETDARHWLGANVGYRPNRHHSLSLFVGQRRGGPACTSGICYEVLDFTGAELRVTTRF